MNKKKISLFVLLTALFLWGTMAVIGQEAPDQDGSDAVVPVSQDPNSPADQQINDDLIVTSSLCVGFDCINNQTFAYDTLILKENNLRIYFHDTSTSSSFPTNDWRIIINDEVNGGSSYFRIQDATADVSTLTILPGGNTGIGTETPTEKLHVAGNIMVDGSVTELSDAGAKENFAPVSGEEVLDRLSQIPVMTWSYKSGDETVRHMGPTAQDFYAAFGLGADNRHIATVDRDGVALAAIQQLTLELQEKDSRITDLEMENQALRDKVDDLEARLAALEAAILSTTDR